ncbi:hypothetical protein [Corynebacterium macclintockiae]|uniref:hypothetical protein n=1 Tax=Corynebacterium macclintockiae TaxID=2913501 RepID=UPI003EBB13D1
MSANKELNYLLANCGLNEVTAYDVARTLDYHSALEACDMPPLSAETAEVTRADGETMSCWFTYADNDAEEPTGWATDQGDAGEPGDIEQVIQGLYKDILAWLDGCDMSDDQIEGLYRSLEGQGFYGLLLERDSDSDQLTLDVSHENGRSTEIIWDRKRHAFVGEELDECGSWESYVTASTSDILSRLQAQAKL